MEIYQPAEDSYFLSEILKEYLKDKNKNISILDLGSGTGIQAETCRSMSFNNITTADINQEAVELLKKKFKVIKSDLFSNIKDSFHLIIFNPPYLPEDNYDKENDVTGGKRGYELIARFLKEAKEHLNQENSVVLLFSSFSKPRIIKQKSEELGYQMKMLGRKKLFFEELFVVELKTIKDEV